MSAEGKPEEESGASTLEGGNYEVIRGRLRDHALELARRSEALNARRKETFGGQELVVVATERLRTENNCLPVDIVEIGKRLLVGFNVFIGLKSETRIEDVFSLYRFDAREGGYDCAAVPLDEVSGFLADPQFVKDFTTLYKYTRDARFLQFVNSDTRLYAVFQIGASHREIKAFRWAIEANGSMRYLDDRGEREYQPPRQHGFEWRTPSSDDQVEGRYVDIADKVFVSCIDGRLRLSVEDNTRDGHTVLVEPVEDGNQVLADASIRFAELGHLVLLEIVPYREEKRRFFVFNSKTRSAARIDAIGQACIELPEDHGVVFPGGFYLESGEYKLFDGDNAGLEFHKRIASPNGEDVLYLFYEHARGSYALFPYNLIRKEVASPIRCGGYSLFDDGRLVVFRDEVEPTRVHPMQVWQTSFTSVEHAATAEVDDSYLAKVGNAELVRGISDGLSLCRLARTDSPTRQTFEDLIAGANRMLDGYYWLGSSEALDLKTTVALLRDTTETIIDEFEKVLAFKREADKALSDTEQRLLDLGRDLRPEHWRKVEPYLEGLAKLRMLRGQAITLRELREMDLAKLGALEGTITARFDEVSKACVQFLLREDALSPLSADLDALAQAMPGLAKAADVKPHQEKLGVVAEGLALLGEVVGNLPIDDATQRTKILEGLSQVFGQLNRTRAVVDGRRKELASAEGRAEIVVQLAVLGQAVSSALGLADTPEKCDDQLSKLLVQLEELEGRFSDVDDLAASLAEKRDEVHEAFAAKKQQLLDEKNRRIQNLSTAAERILEGVARRGRSQKSVDELNAYFASDAMILKLRKVTEELQALGDSVKADAFLARLKAARQDALRGLRDKLDLFEGEGELIKLGRHRFSINTQPLELTIVPRDGALAFHLTGTDYYQPVDDATFGETRRFWDQALPSETAEIYRGEFLAYATFLNAERGEGGASLQALRDAQRSGKLEEHLRTVAADRHEEGYDRGVHDHDAAKILDRLLTLHDSAGLLRFAAPARALGQLFWEWHDDSDAKRRWSLRAQSLGRLRRSLGRGEGLLPLAREVGHAIAKFVEHHGLVEAASTGSASLAGLSDSATLAGAYLVEELTGEAFFTVSADAEALRDGLLRHLDVQGMRRAFDDDMRDLEGKVSERHALAAAWLDAFIAADPTREARRHAAPEAVAMLGSGGLSRVASAALCEGEVAGLLGQHPRIERGAMTLRIDEFVARLGRYVEVELPAYRSYRRLRNELVHRERASLRLSELQPKVMSAFVRNKLVNEVYLPLVGDNFAKQLGAAGEGKRTDLMGLLLLVSPPGYGKTTLMEYVANRLGLVFVKVNGPALGHGVVSIDPAEAPNATARQEVEKINLAFEMGNNVMLYLDDIQHTNPELLQKFISLCDAQRRIEGVFRGKTRTYDFRGRKFCVVMAGNPYTESGEAFRIPDMLANRADTYNLGDVLSGKEEAFASSYLENALTSNQVLQPLATREQSDVDKLIRMSRGEPVASTDLKHGYSNAELEEIVAVFRHLGRIQTTLLAVNQEYIASAAQDDRFRTEPPFKLQGSYRNMNKLAEKVVPAMSAEEIETWVSTHYQGEAQTLTTGAEANLLKLAEMRGRLAGPDAERWEEIRREYVRHKRMGGATDDPMTRVAGTIAGIGADLQSIRDVLGKDKTGPLTAELEAIRAALSEDRTAPLAAELEAIRAALSEDRTAPLAAELEAIRAALSEDRTAPLAAELEAIRSALSEDRTAPLAGALDKLRVSLAKDRTSAIAAELGAIRAALSEDRTASLADAIDGLRPALAKDRSALVATELAGVRAALENQRSGDLTGAIEALRGVLGASSTRGIEEAIDGLRLDIRAVREVMRPKTTPPPPMGADGRDHPETQARDREDRRQLIHEALVPLARAAVMRGEESAVTLAAVRALLEGAGVTTSRRPRTPK